MKRSKFKFGQLITVNHIVYRCQEADCPCPCGNCDISFDHYSFAITGEQARKICVRCYRYYINFKRLSK